MIKVAICDDQQIIINKIEKILEMKNVETKEDIIVEKFICSVKLLEKLKNNGNFDLIFLDIEMPEISGLELSRHLRTSLNDKKTQIVFISSKDKYMIDMFDVAPLRFIQKNKNHGELISKTKINEAIDYIIALKYDQKDCFTYEKGGNTFRIKIEDIIYFKSQKRTIEIHGKYENVSYYQSFKELEEYIASKVELKNFVKCNRGIIVNKEYCTSLIGTNLNLSDGSVLPVSRIVRNKVRDLIFKGGS